MKLGGLLLLLWYVFWGFAIKPHSIPGILNGQLTIWLLYAALLLVFLFALRASRRGPAPAAGPGTEPPFTFTWRGFVQACLVGTAVTTVCRLALIRFASIQVMLLFSFYVVAGLMLFAGTLLYIGKSREPELLAGPG